MRIGKFEVKLLRTDDVQSESTSSCSRASPYFDEVTIPSASGGGDQVYVVAEPGKEYCVRINVYRDANGVFTPKYIRVGIYVDDIDVNYWKRIDLSNESLLPTDVHVPVSASFWGFKKSADDMRGFVFAMPSVVTELSQLPALQPAHRALGTIKVVIYEAKIVGGTFENRPGCHELPPGQSICEGKKFWQQASVATNAGQKLSEDREAFNPLTRWANKSPVPLATMLLNYHTQSMITCIGSIMQGAMGAMGGNNSSGSSSSGSGSGSSRSHYGGGTKGGPCMHEDGGRFAVFESTEGDPVSD